MRTAFWITTILCAVISALIVLGTVERINEHFDAERARLDFPQHHAVEAVGAAVGTLISGLILPLLGLLIGSHWSKKTGDTTGKYRSLRYWSGISTAILGFFGAGILILIAWPIGYFIARSVGKHAQAPPVDPLTTSIANQSTTESTNKLAYALTVAVAIIVILVACLWVILYAGSSTSLQQIAANTPLPHQPTSSPPPPTAEPSPLVRYFSSSEEAQQEAIRMYPSLGVAGSPFNKAFLARYREYKRDVPSYFNDNSWPVRLAEETARIGY